MIKIKNIKIILFFSCFLLFQQSINAETSINLRGYKMPASLQKNNGNDINNDNTQVQNSSTSVNENTNQNLIQENPSESANSNNSGNQSSTLNLDNKENSDNKSKPLIKKQNENNFGMAKSGFNQSKPVAKKEKDSPNVVNSFLNHNNGHKFTIRNYFNLTTLMTILGVLGTFFGLFSSWLIYHLNKKNSNPLVIDKKNSALKYLEELHKINDILYIDRIKKIRCLSEILQSKELSALESNEFKTLPSFYSEISANISEIPVISIHDRYKKHIKGKKYKVFEALISNYDLLGNYTGIETVDIFSEDNINEWQNKLESLLDLQKNTDKALKLLRKDLR